MYSVDGSEQGWDRVRVREGGGRGEYYKQLLSVWEWKDMNHISPTLIFIVSINLLLLLSYKIYYVMHLIN